MRFGSLFSGIGGMDLGLERAGMQCAWQVEIDPFCRKVLAKHWPDVMRYEDVRTVGKHNLEPVDLIAGGFPCQDISNAGKRAGIDGERSGLWSEYHRIICELRPRFVLVENVAALLNRGMGRVLGDLSKSGYDAIWRVFSACEFGFPHSRERLFLIAYASSLRPYAYILGNSFAPTQRNKDSQKRCKDWLKWKVGVANVLPKTWGTEIQGNSEPVFLRVANGIPKQVDSIKGLGNAVVPQVAEWIGRRIMDA